MNLGSRKIHLILLARSCYDVPIFGKPLDFRGKCEASPRLKTEDRPVICANYKSSLNGDFNGICNKTCDPLDRFDGALRFKYRAIPGNAERLAVSISLGREADKRAGQCWDGRSGRWPSGGCPHPFRDRNRTNGE